MQLTMDINLHGNLAMVSETELWHYLKAFIRYYKPKTTIKFCSSHLRSVPRNFEEYSLIGKEQVLH